METTYPVTTHIEMILSRPDSSKQSQGENSKTSLSQDFLEYNSKTFSDAVSAEKKCRESSTEYQDICKRYPTSKKSN